MASVKLNDIPKHIYDALQDKQAGIKKGKGIGMFSLEKTIYIALEEWVQSQNKKPPSR